MKCIIQIPCHNEASSLPLTLAALPRSIAGVDTVEWLVIDDGSSDPTADVARKYGVDHVVRLPQHLGLATAFVRGLEACLEHDADIIVNTDADNQYFGGDIVNIVSPIIAGDADIVVGSRDIDRIPHFSWSKKRLQRLGSLIVGFTSGARIPDATSGLRAFSRNAALRMQVFSRYTYTLETLILAGRSGLAVVSVPVRVNADLRPSRLVKSVRSYVLVSALTVLRVMLVYYPFRAFGLLGGTFLAAGIAVGIRFLDFYATGQGQGHVQSLILSTILITTGTILLVAGALADLIAVNRRILEEVQARSRASHRDRI